jgi:hypothetical protein
MTNRTVKLLPEAEYYQIYSEIVSRLREIHRYPAWPAEIAARQNKLRSRLKTLGSHPEDWEVGYDFDERLHLSVGLNSRGLVSQAYLNLIDYFLTEDDPRGAWMVHTSVALLGKSGLVEVSGEFFQFARKLYILDCDAVFIDLMGMSDRTSEPIPKP